MPNYDLFYSPVVGPMDIIIMGSKGFETEEATDILDVLHNLELAAMTGLMTTTMITVTLMTLILTLHKKCRDLKRFVKEYMKNYYRILFECYDVYVDQEDLRTRQWTVRIMWCSICISVYIVIHGILLNLMSVDSVVKIEPPVVDQLSDLFLKVFSHVEPIIIKSLYFYPAFRNDQKFARLKRRVKKENLLDVGKLGPLGLQQRLLSGVVSGKEVMTLSMYMERCVRPVLCLADYNGMNQIHLSKSIHSGMLTTFYNKNIDPRLRTLLDYRIRSFIETRQTEHEVRILSLGIIQGLDNTPLSLNVTMCIENDAFKDEKTLPPPTPWRALRTTLMLFFIGFYLSVIAFCLENGFLMTQTRHSSRQTISIAPPSTLNVFLAERYRTPSSKKI